ncbi:unnamed protein product [Rotaria sp. Silwood1]|nr:unnamed protein product [Rotaria sp. Silwood1]
MAANTRSKQQVKNELTPMVESNDISPLTQLIEDSDDGHTKQSNNIVQHKLEKWDAYREYEQQQLESINLLTEEEMLNIDQWLLELHQVYEELRYPMSRRIWQTITYLQDGERLWYEQEKQQINNDWRYFCKKLKQHIYDRFKSNIISSTKDHNLSSVKNVTQEEQFSSTKSSSIEINSSLSSALSITMAREIIKSPTYFRGAKDDVMEWLEKLEQRFAMANWTDELKLQYISIHLQEDANRWWNQSSTKITSWSHFVEAIKQAFGSTKMKELTFEQLRTYKQSINQSITQYYDKVIELCKRVDTSMTDSMKLQYLMAGVKQSLKLHIALHDPQSPEAFLSYARKVEDTLSLTTTDYDLNSHDNYQNTSYDRQPTTSNINPRQAVDSRCVDIHQSKPQTSISGHINNSRNKNVSYSSSSNYTTSKRPSASIDGVASKNQYENPSQRTYVPLIYLNAYVYDKQMKLMIDTGANRTFITKKALNSIRNIKIINRIQRQVFLADGYTSITVYGEVDLSFVMNNIYTSIRALIVKNLCVSCILGMDYIIKYKLIINTVNQTISIGVKNYRLTIPIDNSEKINFETTQASKLLSIGISVMKTKSLDTHIDHLVEHINDHDQQHQVRQILIRYNKLFDSKKTVIASNVKPHEIKTIDHPPPTSKAYYSTPQKQEAMHNIIQELFQSGLIRQSYSNYAAPAMLVPKKDNTWRMVVDYKKLNNITIKDNHPLPNMEQTIQILGGGYKFFSKLDMKSGFWQIPIKEEDKHKTAFITPDGLYEWNVLPQGLKNSPPSFQRLMLDLLSPCRQFALVYIDDIVIFSYTFEEHVKHLTQVLSILSSHNLQLNSSKCFILHRQIDYLSHTVSQFGVKPNKEKIQAIMNLREPTTLAAANKFIGGISWYRKFIPQFASVAAPIISITNLTKPNRKKFVWGTSQHEAFIQLKQLLINQPLFLQFPNDDYPVILTTDASKVGIGGTLQQIINGETKNLYYYSQITSPTQRRYDPIELEALAIWACFRRMRSYLLGRSIIIYTDHCPLCNMMNKSVKNRRVDRISMLLQEYDIEKIIHIKGQQNCLADYLSRNPIQIEPEEIFEEDYGISTLFNGEPPVSVSVSVDKHPVLGAVVTRSMKKQQIQQESELDKSLLSIEKELESSSLEKIKNLSSQSQLKSYTCNQFDIKQIKFEQEKDPIIQKKVKEIQQNPTRGSFVLHEGLLYKLMPMNLRNITKIRLIYIPSSMINSLLKAYHSDPLGAHFGIRRTYYKLKNKYWWPDMKQSITRFIKSCLPCQQYNVSRFKKPGLLCPIETPPGPFQLIGIDYCGPFKRTPRENQYVLCITDYFTRWITAVALPDCTAQTTAQAIFNEYICRYGVPVSILTDQGTHFNNQLMESMAQLIGYNHILSTVYHPQSNGMVERFNATFVPQLAKLHDREHNNWDEYLQSVVFAYNTGIHAATNYSPFQLQFGHDPRMPTDATSNYVFYKPSDYYNQLKKSLRIIQQHARNQSIYSHMNNKKYYDKNRSNPQYEINDKILIRIHGLRSKLDPHYTLNPKIIIQRQHPIYWVRDQLNDQITRVHVNDIRPILLP